MPSRPPAVLLVDDTQANLIALRAALQPLDARIVEARSGAAALEEVQQESFAVVLLDVQMPGMDGFETARRMRKLPGGRHLPILFLTAIHRDEHYARRGYATGAADYITKPFDIDVLLARVRAFVDLFRQREDAHRDEYEERTRERDEAQRRLEAFERIASSALVTDDLGAFLHTLLDVFMSAADSADTVSILLRQDDELRVCASIGLADELERATVIPLGQDFAGRIAASRNEILLTESEILAQVRSPWLRERGLRSLFGVPLLVEDEVIGVAHIGTTRASVFSEAEKRLFRALVNRAAWVVSRQRERDRRIEAERKARIDAERANRLKDEFLQTVSHELRTPLNAILGWASSARRGAVGDIDRALGIVERNARAQARIIDDILDLSRVVRGKLHLELVPIEITHPLIGAVEAVRPAAEARGVALDVQIEADVGVVAADSDRMQQVMWNLLSNAIKFTPKGGEVRLRAARTHDAVVLNVSDTGEGIGEDFLPFIFEAFRQGDASTTRRHGGLGLGLAIARQLVQAHGGTIRAHSDGLGRGATFTVELPTPARPVFARRPANGAGAAMARLDAMRVLVVDDDDDTRDLVRDVLQTQGAVVQTAADASEALEQLKRFRPHVLVSDIGMPVADGYMLLRNVRALPADLGGETPAIALTAYASVEDANKAASAGFQMHVPKPVDPMELMARIAEVVGPAGRDAPSANGAAPRQPGAP